MKNVKVFLIPYAGASSLAYCNWLTLFPDSVKPVIIELKGRGKRWDESFYASVEEATNDIASQIQKELTVDTPYILFGHSMGALFVYEAYFELMRRGVHNPIHIFVSGRQAPQIPLPVVPYSQFSNDDFIKVVSKFGGVPKEFNDPRVIEMFLPILRADFRIIENYTYFSPNGKMESDMTVLYGNKDFTTKAEDMKEWAIHAGKQVDILEMKGPHFFIHDHMNEIVKLIVSKAL